MPEEFPKTLYVREEEDSDGNVFYICTESVDELTEHNGEEIAVYEFRRSAPLTVVAVLLEDARSATDGQTGEPS